MAEFQFEFKFEPLPVIWQSLQKAIREDNRRFRCKFNGRAFGAGTAWAVPSRRQSLRAATGSLQENVLPLLRYWLSSRVKKVECFVDIGPQRVTCFSMWNEIFDGTGEKLSQTNATLIASSIFRLSRLGSGWLGQENTCELSVNLKLASCPGLGTLTVELRFR